MIIILVMCSPGNMLMNAMHAMGMRLNHTIKIPIMVKLDGALFAVSDQHCIDIYISSSDEPIQRVADLISIKKPVAANHQYVLLAPVVRANAAPQIRLAARAPPVFGGSLEQCVRKTVLRI